MIYNIDYNLYAGRNHGKEHDEWVLAMIKDKDPDLYRAVLAEQGLRLLKELEAEEKAGRLKHRQWQNRQAIMLEFLTPWAQTLATARFCQATGVSQATVSSLKQTPIRAYPVYLKWQTR